MVVLSLAAGIGIIAMIVAASVPGSYLYYAGLLLTISYIYTFARLRFVTASIVAWLIVVIYEFGAGSPGCRTAEAGH
jgi:hypothetical protein